MDDQRCSLSDLKQENVQAPVAPAAAGGGGGGGVCPKDDLLDMIAGAQSCRLNEQRAPWNVLPGLNRSSDGEIVKCQVSNSIGKSEETFSLEIYCEFNIYTFSSSSINDSLACPVLI